MLWTLPRPGTEPVVAVRTCVDGFFGESCDGHGGGETELLGYASRTPSTRMPRRLRRCHRTVRAVVRRARQTHHAVNGDFKIDFWYHTLDAECVAEDVEDAVVGYVL